MKGPRLRRLISHKNNRDQSEPKLFGFLLLIQGTNWPKFVSLIVFAAFSFLFSVNLNINRVWLMYASLGVATAKLWRENPNPRIMSFKLLLTLHEINTQTYFRIERWWVCVCGAGRGGVNEGVTLCQIFFPTLPSRSNRQEVRRQILEIFYGVVNLLI